MKKQELHNHLVSPEVAAPVVLVTAVVDMAAASSTFEAFVASRRMKVIGVSVATEAATNNTIQLQNSTSGTNVTNADTPSGADAALELAVTEGNEDLAQGDVLVLATGAGATPPGLSAVTITCQLLE